MASSDDISVTHSREPKLLKNTKERPAPHASVEEPGSLSLSVPNGAMEGPAGAADGPAHATEGSARSRTSEAVSQEAAGVDRLTAGVVRQLETASRSLEKAARVIDQSSRADDQPSRVMVEQLQACGVFRVRVTNRKLLPAERAKAGDAANLLGRKAYLSYRYPYLYIRLGEPIASINTGDSAESDRLPEVGNALGNSTSRRGIERHDIEGVARETANFSRELSARERP
jgi:hypothetical protein